MPPAILFLSQWQNENQTDYIRWFFEKLERLAACMHVCARNINQRIERYAELLTELEGTHGPDQPLQTIELRDSEKSDMLRALNGNIYELTARRRNYVILRLDSFMSDGGASYEPNVLTIEHVLPQTVTGDSPWLDDWPDEEMRQEWVHRIANLVPLNMKRNQQAQNYAFAIKKTAYFGGKYGQSSYALTTQVLKTDSWDPDVVKQRQRELIEVFAESWDLGSPENILKDS